MAPYSPVRGAAITRDQFQGLNSLEDWKRRRPEVHNQLLDMLGLHPLPPRTPLNARARAPILSSVGKTEYDRFGRANDRRNVGASAANRS